MEKCITVILLTLLQTFACAQQFSFQQYRVGAGLPSDIVKACAQDSLGYFWIATDEGIAKYDGIKFTNYPKATHSNYTKGFFTTRSGRLLAFGDLDLIEIKNYGDTVLFKSVCPAARAESDSSLLYPKLVFEDQHGSLWVSESQAVVRLGSKSMKRYSFDLANRSPQFLRSFSFFEDRKGELYITSYQGNVFRYDSNTDAFIPLSDKFPEDVQFVSTRDTTLIVGSSKGVYMATLGGAGSFQNLRLQMKIPMVSCVAQIDNNRLLVTTRGDKHYIGNLQDGSITPILYTTNNVNSIYISKEKDIWLSGNEGLIVMQEDLFQGINDGVFDFIESITEDSARNIVYYATSRTLYSFNTNSKKREVLLDMPGGYFQSLVHTPDGIWVANAFSAFLFGNGKIKKHFDFSIGRRFVTELMRDSRGNMWLTIPGTQHALVIDQAFNMRRYRVDLGKNAIINSIHEGQSGMFISSAGENSYLYFKSNADSVFRNISVPLPMKAASDFNVYDLAIVGETVWLATSDGLMKYQNNQIERIQVRERFENLSVKSVQIYPDNRLLLSTANGLIMYSIESGLQDLFNESAGLPSNAISNRGLFVGSDKKVWLGTAKGISFSTRALTELTPTLPPHFIAVLANGKQTSFGKKEIAYGSFVTIDVSSITFPEKEMNYQYRFNSDDSWKNSTSYELQFPFLDAGGHKLEVRAKKNGSYVWSDSSYLEFTMDKPFWQRWWFYGMCVFAALILMSGTSVAVNARSERKNRKLQTLVDLRTLELRKSNEELVHLNIEKNNLISIVAHDLKSPLKQILGLLGLIRATTKPDEELSGYLTFMEKSATRLDGMILKILDVDAIESKKGNLTLERIDVAQVLNAIGDRYDSEAAKKSITIKSSGDSEAFVKVDKNYLDQILENLVSNAIKFSPFNRSVYLNVANDGVKITCEIRDEGPGLSENDKKMLFERFQKLSAKPTGDEISTGLGLSIVKKYVDAMDGNIWCVSEVDQGASFFVSFNIAPAA